MDQVAQVNQPHQVARKRDAPNRNMAMGMRGGRQIDQQDPMAVMGCERDRQGAEPDHLLHYVSTPSHRSPAWELTSYQHSSQRWFGSHRVQP